MTTTNSQFDMDLQVVPRVFEELEEIKVYYSLEKPGTMWSKASIAEEEK